MARAQVCGAVLLLTAALVAQGAPIVGSYASIELGGAIVDGRWSESYVGGGPGQIGNTVHAASWNGTTLATQWELSGPAINAPPTVLLNTVVGGTGTIVYFTTYGGGTLLLDDSGPWWTAGDPGTAYTVNVTSYTHTTTNQYVGGVVVASSTASSLKGVFADYPGYSISFAVSAAVPSGYPSFVPDTAASGAWGVAQKIRMEIPPPVPEPATLGLLGLGVFGLVVGRRRSRMG